MFQYIRHLNENSEWEFSNVKTVGELTELKTENKEDIVSAVNEIFNIFDVFGDENLENIIKAIKQAESDMLDLAERLKGEKLKLEGIIAEFQGETGIGYINEVKERLEDRLVDAEDEINNLLDKSQSLFDKLDVNAEELDGKIKTVENELINTNEELSNKMSTTEFDKAVGVNKWIGSFYDKTKLELGHPQLTDISGLEASHIDEVDDSTSLYPYTLRKKGILHLFTNVRVSTDKTINLNLEHSEGFSALVNGGYVYYRDSSYSGGLLSISLRSGWNRLEFLVYVDNSIGEVSLSNTISKQVEKMTTTIGVGGKDETRLTHTETLIKQTREEISLKAEKTIVEELGNKITENTAELSVQAEKISAKVDRVEYNAYNGRLENAESFIEQTADSIKNFVMKEDIDTINRIVTQNSTTIEQLSDNIKLSVTKEELDKLNGIVSTANASIELLEGSITSKVDQKTLDELNGVVASQGTSIKNNATAIELKASRSELDNVNGRIDHAETLITNNADEILLKASKTSVDSLTDRIELSETAIKQNSDSIELTAKKSELDDLNKTILDMGSSILQTAKDIALGVTSTGLEEISKRLTTTEAGLKVAQDSVESKVSQAIFDDTKKVVTSNLAFINLHKDKIESMVTKATFDDLEKEVINHTTRIEQTEKSIKSSVTQKTFDDFKSNEYATLASDFEQTATAIKGLVSKEDEEYGKIMSWYIQNADGFQDVVKANSEEYGAITAWYTQNKNGFNNIVTSDNFASLAGQTFNTWGVGLVEKAKIVSEINATLEGIKIRGDKVNIDGQVTFSSLSKDMQKEWNESVDLTEYDESIEGLEAMFENWGYSNTTFIDGAKIFTGTISANKINAKKLSAIATDLGSITAGSININNKFIVDSEGNMRATSATIGEDSVFNGNITTKKNAYVGDSIRLGKDDGVMKQVIFNDGAKISGGYGMIGANMAISSDALEISCTNVDFTRTGSVDFTGINVYGITAKFG